MINQRKIALSALIDVEKNDAYSNLVLQKAFLKYNVDNVDRPFISALFYGVLDRKITLDFVISKFIKKPISKIMPITLSALRLSIFQMMFMDKIPQSAAVNESVNLVKNSKERYNAAFVNAVLRNFLRQGISLPDDNSVESLSIRYSCPEWIIKSFFNDYGEDTAISLLSHFLTTPDITVRVNSLKVSDEQFISLLNEEGVDVKPLSIPHAFSFKSGIDIKGLNSYKSGLFYAQDIQSQIAVSKLNISSFERILDMCAAPGGKTFFAAIATGNNGKITSGDFYEKRVELIRQGAKRLGLNNIDCRVCDSRVFDKSLGKYDAVICDVPCSGLGVIRRKPEIKYKTNIDLNELKVIQSDILENASRYLKPEGRVLYSTCTVRRDENEGIVSDFLDKHSNFELKYEHTFLPNTDNTDGFYCAVIKSR